MIELFITAPAKNDLVDIWSYITIEGHPEHADAILDRLYSQFELIVLNPGMGASRKKIGENVRLYPVDRIKVIYWLKDSRLEILRVQHSALDSNRLSL